MITNFFELKRVLGPTKAASLIAAANDISVNSALMVRQGKDAPQKHWSVNSLICVCDMRISSGTHRTNKEFYMEARKKLKEML